ncbi:hypothetical protein FIBSPDRAFT_902340 [Athelia psychrophila]|uniref:Uncharacterized protein n=1 Tax=Athelia psychrophila TaxID=1759441 RepID=A0A167XCA9_9AGAM|nr:hypothetical protein FIBSPDRAFT_902340 [Fibularhizoctonia sp. CBS 109695]
MLRPDGCLFLGSRVTEVTATINSTTDNPASAIIDSGSDITLISHKFLIHKNRDTYLEISDSGSQIKVENSTSGTLTNEDSHAFKVKEFIYVEKVFTTHHNTEDMYAAPDSFISKDHTKLHIANFSTSNITIQPEQVLGTARNPRAWLDHKDKYTREDLTRMETRTSMIKKITEIRSPKAQTAQSKAK